MPVGGGFPGWVMGWIDAGLAVHPTMDMKAEQYGTKFPVAG